MDLFELVFDNDWEHTEVAIRGGHDIAPGGSFLDPGVEDESNNGANRGALLRAYRNLLESMTIAGVAREPY